MKKSFTFLIAVLLTVCVYAQAPQKMSYQAVIRDANNNLVTSHAIGMRISILQGSVTGTPTYVETQALTTNTNGLVTAEIGNGTIVSGIFASINWANGPYFIKSETDPTGGTNYTISGTSQLLSVPYALHAKTAENGFSGVYSDLTGKPVLWDSTYASIKNKPTLFDGQYSSLTGKPNLSIVATSGSYNDLSNKPNISIGANIGDMQYWNGTTWVMIPVGQSGQYLQLNSLNIPAWSGVAYPSLTTTTVVLITDTTAISGGNIINDGGVAITSRGVCWNTSANPTKANNKTIDSTGTSTFVSSITGLTSGTTYYIRAYATNSLGTAYGNEIIFTTTAPPIIDIDGNKYDTVHIGTQIWMKQNLKVTHYRNGDSIPNVTDNTWSNLTTGAYCNYNNDANNATTYGRLYNFYTVVDTRNLCPTGWHVPSNTEWTTLTDYLDGQSLAGGKLKEIGTTHWISPNTAATNETGFTALPAGYRYYLGAYSGVGEYGYWWSSTELDASNGGDRNVFYYTSNVYGSWDFKTFGYSVSCVKD